MKDHMLFHLAAGLVLAMFIISLSVTLALNAKFIYYSDIDRYDLDTISGLTKEELRQDYRELIDYNSIFGDDNLDFPHFTLSGAARQHFKEARDLFMFFGWGVPVFGILAAILALTAHRRKYGSLYLAVASFISIVLPSALGAFALLAWDRFFVVFHEISFDNDLWLFDPAVDPVINVLPTEYFFHEAIAIFALVIAGGLISLFAYIKTRRASAD